MVQITTIYGIKITFEKIKEFEFYKEMFDAYLNDPQFEEYDKNEIENELFSELEIYKLFEIIKGIEYQKNTSDNSILIGISVETEYIESGNSKIIEFKDINPKNIKLLNKFLNSDETLKNFKISRYIFCDTNS